MKLLEDRRHEEDVEYGPSSGIFFFFFFGGSTADYGTKTERGVVGSSMVYGPDGHGQSDDSIPPGIRGVAPSLRDVSRQGYRTNCVPVLRRATRSP